MYINRKSFMTTAWAHLPNAKHIDAVIESLETNPQQWADAWNRVYPNGTDAARNAARAMAKSAARDAVRDAAWDAARNAALDAAWNSAWDAARNAAWNAARDSALDAAWNAAWNSAILALMVYDDCGHLLTSKPEEVLLLAKIGVPAAVLIYPASLVFNEIKEVV